MVGGGIQKGALKNDVGHSEDFPSLGVSGKTSQEVLCSGVKIAPGQTHAVVMCRYLERMNSVCRLQGMIKNVLEDERPTPMFNDYAPKRDDTNVKLFLGWGWGCCLLRGLCLKPRAKAAAFSLLGFCVCL